MSEYDVVKVDENISLRLRVKNKRRVPYDKIVNLLIEGYTVFIPEMNRKTASYVKRYLSSILEIEVEMYPSELDGVQGYAFKISIK